MDNTERDAQIALEYLRGGTASKIARKYKLSVPTVYRVLKDRGASRKSDVITQHETSRVIDRVHTRLGHKLYLYRFRKNVPPSVAADLIAWSVRKLRNVEQGYSAVTLTDLTEMAKYMGITLSELVEGINDR